MPSRLAVTSTTDAEAALSDARYVVNQIRVGGLQARALDETFPRSFELPGEETVGPGGFANALRTIPVAMKYAQLIERVAPKATLLTFANPSSAKRRLSRVRTARARPGRVDAANRPNVRVGKAFGNVQPSGIMHALKEQRQRG